MAKYKNITKFNVTVNTGNIVTIRPNNVAELTIEQAKPFVEQRRLELVQEVSFDANKGEGEMTISTENKKK